MLHRGDLLRVVKVGRIVFDKIFCPGDAEGILLCVGMYGPKGYVFSAIYQGIDLGHLQ